MSKTACVYHSIDLDGWMSAAIVELWWEQKKRESDKDTLDMIGYNYGQPMPELTGFDQVIMCDISFPKERMEVLSAYLGNNFFWCDHHISAIKDSEGLFYYSCPGIRDTKFSACELTWKYFFPNKDMPEIVRLLGRYDCFGHKGTSEESKVLEFQYGARQIISNNEQAYEWLTNCMIEQKNKLKEFAPCEFRILESGKSIYAYLCTDAKRAYQNRFTIYFGEYAFCAINKERFNPINFGIQYHNDKADDVYFYDGCACFHRRSDGKWSFSLYNDNGMIDCSIIAKSFGGGGHRGAAGFVVDNVGLLNLLK